MSEYLKMIQNCLDHNGLLDVKCVVNSNSKLEDILQFIKDHKDYITRTDIILEELPKWFEKLRKGNDECSFILDFGNWNDEIVGEGTDIDDVDLVLEPNNYVENSDLYGFETYPVGVYYKIMEECEDLPQHELGESLTFAFTAQKDFDKHLNS